MCHPRGDFLHLGSSCAHVGVPPGLLQSQLLLGRSVHFQETGAEVSQVRFSWGRAAGHLLSQVWGPVLLAFRHSSVLRDRVTTVVPLPAGKGHGVGGLGNETTLHFVETIS